MTRTILALLSALILTAGCSSANAQCPGGHCSSAGFYSPWVGVWYYASPCSNGICRSTARPKADENTVPEEPETPPTEPECPNLDENAAETDTPDFAPFCRRVAELINAQRAALGLPALVLDTSLCAGCDRHSRFMASYGFQHAYYSGRECIASGVRSPEAVVNLWLNSSGHRAIILGGGKILGVGCSGTFWTLRVR